MTTSFESLVPAAVPSAHRPSPAPDHEVLRAGADGVTAARLDLDLRLHQRRGRPVMDARLVDPRIEALVEEVAGPAREQARVEGYAAGWSEGRREAQARMQAELDAHHQQVEDERRRHAVHLEAALRALSTAARALEVRSAPAADEVTEAACHLAFALCEQLLGRELELAAEPGLDAIRRAISLAPQGRAVVVRLNPADLAALGAAPTELDDRPLHLVADPTLRSGDAVAECDASVIDARLGEALERVRGILCGGGE